MISTAFSIQHREANPHEALWRPPKNVDVRWHHRQNTWQDCYQSALPRLAGHGIVHLYEFTKVYVKSAAHLDFYFLFSLLFFFSTHTDITEVSMSNRQCNQKKNYKRPYIKKKKKVITKKESKVIRKRKSTYIYICSTPIHIYIDICIYVYINLF